MRSLRRGLLRWYDAKARALPWRRSRDSYRVWVAEIMLQQTRVSVVVPAYRRFLRRFPTLATLARASAEGVLSAWSGLGYYSRARALHRAARMLHANGGRAFPRDMKEARALPGVGAYTAAAVLSIAYGEAHAAVDGNVARVLSRLFRLPRPDAKGEPHASLASRLLDRKRPGDWNQAIMELGETLCLPVGPRCDACPLRRRCRAYRASEVASYPAPRARKATERVQLEMTMLRDARGRFLLERGAFPFLPHMWLPPIAVAGSSTARRNGKKARAGRFRHAIVHRDFHVQVFDRELPPAALEKRARARVAGAVQRRLFAGNDLQRIGRSSLLTKALALVDPGKGWGD